MIFERSAWPAAPAGPTAPIGPRAPLPGSANVPLIPGLPPGPPLRRSTGCLQDGRCKEQRADSRDVQLPPHSSPPACTARAAGAADGALDNLRKVLLSNDFLTVAAFAAGASLPHPHLHRRHLQRVVVPRRGEARR